MASLNTALFRIDPTEGLLQYVQAVKPFHSKVLDVFVEYIYTEPLTVTMSDRVNLSVGLMEPDRPVLYTCGFGFVWNPYSEASPLDLPQANIVSAGVNSFLVSMPASTPFNMVVSNLQRNQLTLATPFNISNVTPALKQFVVAGDLVSGPVTVVPGDTIYISSNTDASTNGKYTVATVTVNVGLTASTVTVVEPVSLVATVSGQLNVPVAANDVPYWPAGAAVRVTSAGTYPFPLQPNVDYYFNPTPTFGVFNLASTRYPQQFSDIIDLSVLGVGQLQIFRSQPFVPGESIRVSGSFEGDNDGVYTINTITPEGANFRLQVLQHVPRTSAGPSDGTMVYAGSFGDPYCAVASAPDLYTAAFMHERIDFTFGPLPVQPYLFDTFSGIGNLTGYTNESGHTWSIIQLVDTLDELILTGDGSVTTADTLIWAKSDWVLPGPTFSYEVELFVKERPASGSPYFRFFIKETGGTFYGPYVDVYPDAGGTIFIDARNGNLANAGLIVDTGINVNQKLKVKLNLISNNQITVEVNGVVVYTSAVVTWPTLDFVGFNFTVPAGDTTQFHLDRILAQD